MNHTILEQHGLSNLVEAATALATFSLCSRAPTVTHDVANQICSPPALQISQSLPSTINHVVLGQSPCSTASSHGKNEKLFSPICADASDACKETFPERLMAILNDDGVSSDIISWLPNGLSFIIARPDLFMESILPKYITPMQQQQDARTLSTKYPSFTRKLNRWYV
jgi:HSF-type DNA-binding